ncbi:MAG: T9SS type A sorting domain-containing protein [Bacteroidia bacterium]
MKIKYPIIIVLAAIMTMNPLKAQLSLTTMSAAHTITFDANLANVNNGAYTAAAGNVQPAPVAGQLSSNAWAISGLSDGNVAFAGTSTGTDFARGASAGGVTTGGLYGFDVDNTAGVNRALGIQQTSTDMTVGYVYLRMVNNTGSTITQLAVSYDIFYFNDQDNSETVAFAYSDNNANYRTDYTHDFRTPELLGAATWISVNRTITLSNLNIPNGGFYYFRWTVNDLASSPSRDEFAFDNIAVTPTTSACVLPAEPTVAASNLQFWFPSCNGVRLSWTAGNGSRRIVVVRQGSAVSVLPTDQVSYSAAPIFGATGQTAVGQFVVHNASGNNLLISGLSPSTTYHFAIVEYNGTACGENYLTSSVLTGSVTTAASCSPCPQLITGYINACNGLCGEGTNELLLFTTGGWYFPVRRDEDFVPTDIIQFGNTFPPNIDYSAGFTSMPATVASMNTAVGPCSPAVFYDGLSIPMMPPNTRFIILPETFCTPSSYTYAALCGFGPIYVFFTSDLSWGGTGNFTHNPVPAVTRYFRTDFSFVTGPGCVVDYDYNTGSLSGVDGDYVVWNGGGSPTLYGNSACGIPATNLPVELISFTAEADENNQQVNLNWRTASEQDNDFFEVRRTTDGSSWTTIARVDGAGNSTQLLNYAAIDPNPIIGVNYYRLRQVDFNGQESFSEVVPVEFKTSEETNTVFPSPSSGQFTISGTLNAGDVIEVYDLTGQLVFRREQAETGKQQTLDLSSLAEGSYLIHLSSPVHAPQTMRIVISR